MFTFLIEVECQSMNDIEKQKVYHLIQGSSFADVTQTIENAYGNDLINITVEVLSDTLPIISENMVEELEELNTF